MISIIVLFSVSILVCYAENGIPLMPVGWRTNRPNQGWYKQPNQGRNNQVWQPYEWQGGGSNNNGWQNQNGGWNGNNWQNNQGRNNNGWNENQDWQSHNRGRNNRGRNDESDSSEQDDGWNNNKRKGRDGSYEDNRNKGRGQGQESECKSDIKHCFRDESPEYWIAFENIELNPVLIKEEISDFKNVMIKRLSEDVQKCYRQKRQDEIKCKLEEKDDAKNIRLSNDVRDGYNAITDIENNKKISNPEQDKKIRKVIVALDEKELQELFTKLPSMRKYKIYLNNNKSKSRKQNRPRYNKG